MDRPTGIASSTTAPDPWTVRVDALEGDWADAPSAQEQAAAAIRRSLMCAEIARAGNRDLESAVDGLSHALLADVDRGLALGMAHAWLSRNIPSGMFGGRRIDDAEAWRAQVAGPAGSPHDRIWLAWGLAVAVAELTARVLPWGPPAAALVELLMAEGYEPTPWELRELRRCRRARPA